MYQLQMYLASDLLVVSAHFIAILKLKHPLCLRDHEHTGACMQDVKETGCFSSVFCASHDADTLWLLLLLVLLPCDPPMAIYTRPDVSATTAAPPRQELHACLRGWMKRRNVIARRHRVATFLTERCGSPINGVPER